MALDSRSGRRARSSHAPLARSQRSDIDAASRLPDEVDACSSRGTAFRALAPRRARCVGPTPLLTRKRKARPGWEEASCRRRPTAGRRSRSDRGSTPPRLVTGLSARWLTAHATSSARGDERRTNSTSRVSMAATAAGSSTACSTPGRCRRDEVDRVPTLASDEGAQRGLGALVEHRDPSPAPHACVGGEDAGTAAVGGIPTRRSGGQISAAHHHAGGVKEPFEVSTPTPACGTARRRRDIGRKVSAAGCGEHRASPPGCVPPPPPGSA